MIQFALQPKSGCLLFLPLVFVIAGALVTSAQSPRAAGGTRAAPMAFAEITSQLHISLPPISLPSGALTLPTVIRSQEYSLEYARRNLVPAMGGSICVGDFDGDGHPDLYVIVPGGSNHLFQNRADGTFVDVTDKARVPGTGADLSGAFADFDKTGNPSLFVAGLGGVTLYHNNGDGTFTDTTEKAGLKGKPGELATSVLLFDADNDGFLDLLVTVYTDLSVPPSKASFTFPNDFASANSHLYRNQHDGTFKEVTEAAGLTSNPGRTHKALAADFNHNGRLDLLLLRDNKPPVLYRNQGRGEFEDRTWDAGTEIWKYAYLDAQTSDFNHDGRTDVVLWSTIGNEVLLNQGNGKFEQEESLPLVYAANRAFGFHGMAADFHGNGYDDLLTVDDKSNWHFIVNHAGHFEEAPFTLSPESATSEGSGAKTGAPPMPYFAFLTAAHLRGANKIDPGKIDLVALTMDGRVQIFEERQVRAVGEAPHSRHGK
ncbi:MAG: VCBS repeat-containing protein [Candidatus Sulfotelmatobacter sp.]